MMEIKNNVEEVVKKSSPKKFVPPTPEDAKNLFHAKPITKPTTTFTVELPSNGKLYNGKRTVELSFFTVSDVKRLFNIARGTKTDSIHKLISEKVHDFNAFELTVSDFWYLLYYIRINSFKSNPIKITWTCEKSDPSTDKLCGASNSTELTKDQLIIKEIDPDLVEPISITLPDFGEVNVCLPRTGKDAEAEEVVSKLPGKHSDSDLWVARIAGLIQNQKSLLDNYMLVSQKFTADDLYFLDAFNEEFKYGIVDQVNLKCSGCQEVSQINFRLSILDLVPAIRETRHVRNAVRFGNAHEHTSESE